VESALPVDTQTSSMCTRTPSNREPPQEPHAGQEEQGATALVDMRPHVWNRLRLLLANYGQGCLARRGCVVCTGTEQHKSKRLDRIEQNKTRQNQHNTKWNVASITQ